MVRRKDTKGQDSGSKPSDRKEPPPPRTIATAQWWQDRVSAFNGLDKLLCLDENIEELEWVERRRYWSIHDGDDLSRARFESWGIEIGLELNPPVDFEPFEHFCYELRKDQEENNDDYRRRPSGKEVVVADIDKNGEEITKEKLAELVKWNQAYREAEGVINTAYKERVLRARKLGLKGNAKTKVITVGSSEVVFDKAVEIATKHGVSSQLLLDLKQIKHVVKSTRTICTVPNAGQAAAAFCTRIADRAKVGPHRKRKSTRKGLVPKKLNDMVIQLWRKHPDWRHMDMCKRLDSLVDEKSEYEPLPAWKEKAGGRRLWIELVDHSATKGNVRPFLSDRKKEAFSTPSI